MEFHLVFFWVLLSILDLQTLRQFASMMDVSLGGTLIYTCEGLIEYIDALTLKEKVNNYVGDFTEESSIILQFVFCQVRVGINI